MQCQTPSIKFEQVGQDGDFIITLSQAVCENEYTFIVMDNRQFADVMYGLKAIESQLLLDSQKQFVNNESAPNMPITSREEGFNPETFPSNFEELFSSIPCDSQFTDSIMKDSVGVSTSDLEKCEGNQMEIITEEYDPINFQIEEPTQEKENKQNVEMSPHTERLFQLYHPSVTKEDTVKYVKGEEKPTQARLEKDEHFTRKSEKRVTMRKKYLDKYAQILSERFWQAFEEKCGDLENNRAFLMKTTKEKVETLFSELHASVTQQEFDDKVRCPLSKDIFISCNKTKSKLINIIFKMVSK